MSARVFLLDLAGGRVLSATPKGGNLNTILIEGRKLPDGLACGPTRRTLTPLAA